MERFKHIFTRKNIIICILLLAGLTILVVFFPTVQPSGSIGATFPSNVQIKYESFVPLIPRSVAIAIARADVAMGYHIDIEKYPVNASVALYTGPFMGPGGGTLTDKQVWLVVVSDLPYSSSGPAGMPRYPMSQLNFAIDAKTGIIVHEVLSGSRIYAN